MIVRPIVSADSVPALCAHRRLRFDNARATWAIQAPERVFILDEAAHAVVARCDGETTIAAIVEDLSRLYGEAQREAIEADVIALVQDLADKGVLSP
jgi:pyrroloquinoline quinone biosynthesis protein D